MASKKKKTGKKTTRSQVQPKAAQEGSSGSIIDSGERGLAPILDLAIFLGLVGVSVLAPAIFSRSTYMQFDLPKVVAIRVFATMLGALWVLKTFTAERYKIRKSPLGLLISVFLVLMTIATITGVHLPTAIFGKYGRYEGLLTFLSYGLLAWLAIQTVRTAARLMVLVWTTVVTVTVVSIYGLAQYMGMDPLKWAEVPFEVNRSFSSLGNPDLLAGYLVIGLPIAMTLYFSTRRRVTAAGLAGVPVAAAGSFLAFYGASSYSVSNPGAGSFAFLVAVTVTAALIWGLFRVDRVAMAFLSSVIVFTCLLSTYVRGAWIAGLAVLLALAVLAAIERKREITMRFLAFVATFVVITTAIAILSAGSSSSVTSLTARAASAVRIQEGSAGGRLQIWTSAVNMIDDSPLIGFGPDSFRLIFAQYQTRKYAEGSGLRTIADNSHNYPLQLGSMAGLPALAIFFAIFIAFCLLVLREMKGREDVAQRLALGGVLIAVFGYFVHLLFGVGVVGSNAVYWLLLGAGAGAASLPEKVRKWGAGSRSARSLLGPAIAVLAVVVSVWLFFPYRADEYYIKANQTGRMAFYQQDPQIAKGAITQAVRDYKTALWLNPYADRYYVDFGKFYMDLARQTGDDSYIAQGISRFKIAQKLVPKEFDNYMFLADAYLYQAQKSKDIRHVKEAQEWLTKALVVKPMAGVAMNLMGISYLQVGDSPSAQKYFTMASEYHPFFPDPHFYMGKIFEAAGRKDLALGQYDEALKDDPEYANAKEAKEQLKKAK